MNGNEQCRDIDDLLREDDLVILNSDIIKYFICKNMNISVLLIKMSNAQYLAPHLNNYLLEVHKLCWPY